jgi:hypothetical protein
MVVICCDVVILEVVDPCVLRSTVECKSFGLVVIEVSVRYRSVCLHTLVNPRKVVRGGQEDTNIISICQEFQRRWWAVQRSKVFSGEGETLERVILINGEEERFQSQVEEQRRERIALSQSTLLSDSLCEMPIDVDPDLIIEEESRKRGYKPRRETQSQHGFFQVQWVDTIVGLFLVQK